MPGYEADLAFIHDRGFGAFAQESAPELLRILRRHQVRSGLVVDLGCGSGIWAAELIAAGYDALGVDLSPAMIRLARKRAPQSRFVTASIYDVPLPSCRAVTATSECLNYTFDRRSGERQLSRLLRRIHGALEPGGLLICDLAGPGRQPDGEVRQRFFEAEDWAVLVESREQTAKLRLSREITSFRRVGQLFRRSDERHELRLYPREDMLWQLEVAGFTAQATPAYGKWKLPPGHWAYVAKKAG